MQTMSKSVEEFTWRLHWTLVKGWTEFCASMIDSIMETSDHPHYKNTSFKMFFFCGKPCRPHLILWQLSHLKFSSLFPEIKATWAGKSFLNWGFDRSIALAAVVQQFCKRHHQLCLSIQFRTFCWHVFVRGTPMETSQNFQWKHFRMKSVAFLCQSKTSPSIATVKFVKQYFLFFFKLHE